MNHAVHHRGQFSVYLRLLDVPLPNIYGPTADMRVGRVLDPPRGGSVRTRPTIALGDEARSTNATFAGRSPSRRMKYGNHSLPNGTKTRMR